MRDLGPALSPFNAFQLIQGLETLHLRFCKHQENAAKLANYLNEQKEIEAVIYPSLFDGPGKVLVNKYLTSGHGALVGIELKGGVDAGRQFIAPGPTRTQETRTHKNSRGFTGERGHRTLGSSNATISWGGPRGP